MSVHVGSVHVQCPGCPAVVEVTVTGKLTTDDEGKQCLSVEPDMTDLWAHAWTHEGQAEG